MMKWDRILLILVASILASLTSPRPTATKAPSPLLPDLKALADAANEASKGMAVIWFFFLTFAVFLAVAVGATTHRVLFLEQPVKLPVFGVDLPLVGFYWIAPALFVVLHFYVLVQLGTLAGKVKTFLDAAVQEHGDVVETLRLQCRRLDPFVVAQLLVAQRVGDRAIALRVMSWITLVVGPVVLLLFFQLRFLPYHDSTTSWVHRFLLGADLVLLWLFWPPRGGSEGWDWGRRTKVTFAAFCSAIVFLFATLVVTVQSERAEAVADSFDRWFPGQTEPLAALRSFLFDGRIRSETQRPASLFTRRLVLPDEDFVSLDDATLAGLQRTLSLRGRDLRHAILDRTNLRKVDFGYARLDSASLVDALLQGARFEHADMPHTRFSGAHLQGARFESAGMQSTRFDMAQLQGAVFEIVNLLDADFRGSRLQGATFHGATLDGVRMINAQLQGSAIRESSLLGASFVVSGLQGADLGRSALRGADFRGSRLEGADFRETQLRGARLDGKGNLFVPPGGRSFKSSGGANIWRAQGLNLEVFDAAAIRDIAPAEDRGQLVQDWLASIPKGDMRDAAERRLSTFAEPGGDDEFAASRTLARLDPEQLPDWFAEMVCPKEGSPYTIRMAVDSYLVTIPPEPYAAAVARKLLDRASRPGSCRGLQDLSEEHRGALESLSRAGR